jgi:hypothetical protein
MGAVLVPGGEVRAVGEPGDVADLDEQPGCAGRADAVKVHERGAGGGDEFGELLVGGLLALVDPLEVSDHFRGHPTPRFACSVTRATLASSALA